MVHTSTCQINGGVEGLQLRFSLKPSSITIVKLVGKFYISGERVIWVKVFTMRILIAAISLGLVFAPDACVSAGRFLAQSVSVNVPSVPGWIASSRALNDHLVTHFASRSLILKTRGGSSESSVTADPEGVTLQGVVPSAESLYLPGLLDTSIHRTNKVRFSSYTGLEK
jgi:hypothetical protein